MTEKKELGRLGEELAWHHYQKENYQLLKKNYYSQGSELDLVLWKEETLIIVEVKMRKKISQEVILKELLPPKKRESLKKGTLSFLSKNNISYNTIRFDLFLSFYKAQKNNKIFIESTEVHQDVF
jgi:putative endonuclease